MDANTQTSQASDDNRAACCFDRHGLALTTASAPAAACYRDAIDRVHGGEAGAPELLDEAIALDPAFALAHCARWMLAQAERDTAVRDIARGSTLSLRGRVTPWERGHIECIAAMIDRQPDAWTRTRHHLQAFPQDLLVASQLIGELFFHGGEGKRRAVVELLQGLQPHHRDDWAFAARLGFHTSELGDPQAAIQILRPALEARPHAPFVAHAMAHALLESGARAESYRFLLDWVGRHDPSGPLDGHIHWHLSLGEFEDCKPAAAIERYRRSTAPGRSHCAAGLVLADAGGLFFRMLLDGTPLDGMPRQQLGEFLDTLDGALGLPFVAVHAAALCGVLDKRDTLARCIEAMDSRAAAGKSDAELRVVTALGAYLAGDMPACITALERDRPTAWEVIGGSNEERALIGKLYERAEALAAGS